jgi:hypothetical protein
MDDVKLPELDEEFYSFANKAGLTYAQAEKVREYARAAMAPLIEALETIAAQDSGVVGSTSRADCMAAIAALALRKG